MVFSIFHGLVKGIAFVHVSYSSCGVYRSCALGFVEYEIPRPRANGAHTLAHRWYVPESSPTCGAPSGRYIPDSSTDPWSWRIGGQGEGESHRC